MATMALYAWGLPAGPLGWAIALGGMYVDSKIQGLLLGQNTPHFKPQDIKLQTAQEGTPMFFLMGPEVRVAGQVIWKSAVRSVRQGGGSGGGCGTGPAPPTTYAYYADVAVAMGQPPAGTRIVQIDKLWFDGKVGWKNSPDIDIVSSVVSVSLYDTYSDPGHVIDAHSDTFHPGQTLIFEDGIGLHNGDRVRITGATGATSINGTWVVANVDDTGEFFDIPTTPGGTYTGNGIISKITSYQQIDSPNGGPDLSQFRAGYDVVVSGFASSANNGTFRCMTSFKDTVTGTSYVRLLNINAVAVASGVTVTLHQDLPQFNPKYFTNVVVHDGSPWQPPDSVIEAALGVGNASGNHGVIYVMLQNLNLTAFGDRIPNINAQVQVASTMSVADGITNLVAWGDYGSVEIDVSALTAIPIKGYQVQGVGSTINRLGTVMTTYDVVGYEQNGKIVFVQRKNLVPRVIPTTDLVAHRYGDDGPRKCEVTDARDRDLPREVSVNYYNPSKDYQNGTETYRMAGSRGDSPEQFDTGITMTPSNAQSLARRMLWSTWANRQVVEVVLPPSYIDLVEGQVLQFTDLGRTWTMLAGQIDLGADGTVKVRGPQDEAAALTYAGDPATGGGSDSGGAGILEELDLEIIDIAPLSEGAVNQVGLYWAVAPRRAASFYPGATLFSSNDDVDADFVEVDSAASASDMGTGSGTLGGGVTPYMLDYKNTIDVVMQTGFQPQSVAVDDIITLGKNVVLVGNEFMAYATAALVGTNTYRLSVLLRGLRDTDDQIDIHVPNERVVFPGGGSLNFLPLSITDLQVIKNYRAVPSSGAVEDYPSVPVAFRGGTTLCFSPTAVQGFRNSAGDLTISWDRQTRSIVKMFSTNQIPLNEPRELYEIDVMDSNDVVVKRTLSITAATTVTYSAANQTTDFGSPQASVRLRLYQIGDTDGRGRARRATV